MHNYLNKNNNKNTILYINHNSKFQKRKRKKKTENHQISLTLTPNNALIKINLIYIINFAMNVRKKKENNENMWERTFNGNKGEREASLWNGISRERKWRERIVLRSIEWREEEEEEGEEGSGAVYFDGVRVAASASSSNLGLPLHVTALVDYVVYFIRVLFYYLLLLLLCHVKLKYFSVLFIPFYI